MENFIASDEEQLNLTHASRWIVAGSCWQQDNLRCGAEFLLVPFVGDSTRDENI